MDRSARELVVVFCHLEQDALWTFRSSSIRCSLRDRDRDRKCLRLLLARVEDFLTKVPLGGFESPSESILCMC